MTYATPLNFKLLALSTIVLLGVIVWDGLSVLASRWIHDEAYTHGFILVGLVGYLLYQESDQLKNTKFGFLQPNTYTDPSTPRQRSGVKR